jgi:hypothetical protein
VDAPLLLLLSYEDRNALHLVVLVASHRFRYGARKPFSMVGGRLRAAEPLPN